MSRLKDQIDKAIADVATWPKWMRREAEAVWGEKFPQPPTNNATRRAKTESEPAWQCSGMAYIAEWWNIRDGWHMAQPLEYRVRKSLERFQK